MWSEFRARCFLHVARMVALTGGRNYWGLESGRTGVLRPTEIGAA